MLHRFWSFGTRHFLGGTYPAGTRGGSRWRSDRTDKLPDSPFVPKIVVELGYLALRGVARGISRLGLTANHCTILSVVIGLVSAVCIAAGHLWWGGGLLLVGSSFDSLDGIIARATRTASDAGEFLDATADRISDMAAFAGVLYYYRQDPLGFVLCSIALIGSVLVSYVRAKGEALDVECAVGWMQRHERILWLGLGLVLGPVAARWLEAGVDPPRCHVLLVVLGIIGLFSLVTVVQRSRVVYRALGARNTPPR
jgi:CDP-diacylglycerol---glycerol-3-phosphate 3-phosphatidyltransferase